MSQDVCRQVLKDLSHCSFSSDESLDATDAAQLVLSEWFSRIVQHKKEEEEAFLTLLEESTQGEDIHNEFKDTSTIITSNYWQLLQVGTLQCTECARDL